MKRLLLIVALLSASAGAQNATANGSTQYQTMYGIGTNVHAWSWKSGEIQPALNALVDTLHYSIFRVVHDRMEWAGTGSTRPASTLTNLYNLDSATLQSVYEVSDMQDLWNTIGYLNSKGVTGDQIMVNFMGWTAPWMGGSGAYGSASHITNNAQTNQDIATMLASLVYYGHHRRDISGAHQNLSFGYIAPFNESDGNADVWPTWDCREGPCVEPAQMNTIYQNLIATLNAMGDTTTKILGADNAILSNTDSFTAAFSGTTLARMAHFSVHDYSGSAVTLQSTRSGIKPDFMAETAPPCDLCNNNQPPAEGEWTFGSETADLIRGDIGNGYAAVLSWAGYDAWWYHHDSYDTWGHVGCTQSGGYCTTTDSPARTYAVRPRAYPQAVLALAARPGMKRIAATAPAGVSALAFYDSVTGKFSYFGRNTNGSSTAITLALSNVGTVNTLHYVYTTSSANLAQQADVNISGGQFSFTAPANSFFVLYNFSLTPTPHTLKGGKVLSGVTLR